MNDLFNNINLIVFAISVIFGMFYQNILSETYPERSNKINFKIGLLCSAFVSALTIVMINIGKNLV